jgi:hypothetical protein
VRIVRHIERSTAACCVAREEGSIAQSHVRTARHEDRSAAVVAGSLRHAITREGAACKVGGAAGHENCAAVAGGVVDKGRVMGHDRASHHVQRTAVHPASAPLEAAAHQLKRATSGDAHGTAYDDTL